MTPNNAPPAPPAPSTDSTESPQYEIARLRAETAAKRAKSTQNAALLHELEVERVRARLDTEVGEEGKDWMFYDASAIGAGLYAVKRGDAVTYTRFVESKSQTHAERVQFIASNIAHPKVDIFLAAVAKWPGIAIELSNRLGKLFGLNVEIHEGK